MLAGVLAAPVGMRQQPLKKLATRFRRANRQLGELRQQAAAAFSQVPKDPKSVKTAVRSGRDPLHAAYIAAQNFTSFFAEAVSQFPEFDPYCQVVGPAQEEYMPSGPPMSPLTMSYFTTWAFFDVRFAPDGETIGTCLLDVADLLGMDPFMTETIRQFQGSLMGIYEQAEKMILPALATYKGKEVIPGDY